MNKNLPFYSCNDDELTNIISLINNTSNVQSITMTASVTNEIKIRKNVKNIRFEGIIGVCLIFDCYKSLIRIFPANFDRGQVDRGGASRRGRVKKSYILSGPLFLSL